MKDDLFFSNYLLTRLAATQLARGFSSYGLDYKAEHYMILKLLNMNKHMTQTAIGNGSIKGKAAISRSIHMLETRGLVRRYQSETDAREKMVEMTTEGKNLFRKMNAAIKKMEKIAFRGVAEDDLECFQHVVQQLIINLAKNFG